MRERSCHKVPERVGCGNLNKTHQSRSARKSRMREFEQDPSIAKCPKEPYAGI
ncbi:hypothetical protein ABEP00_18860 [Heyndrickxia sporothermodurans]|uniref:hypothetical protein n=1 Tax=Heyndrickxia sporothermodurans TaxID=46224 RepID=UPI00192AF3C8|nr:hypothetical protein [Heyndrickxia sporothermodurans]MBL5880843.1 hypothetical protein [Heyndrickxia sporothermodurans]